MAYHRRERETWRGISFKRFQAASGNKRQPENHQTHVFRLPIYLHLFVQIKPHQTAHDQFQPNHKLGAASVKPFSGCRKQQKAA
nr:hypothetical protein [uncultured Kingella sp.]